MKIYTQVRDLDCWPRPVQKKRQWKEGRSAMELANAFLRRREPTVPRRLVKLLTSAPSLCSLAVEAAFPEFGTWLPHGSRARCHDIWMQAVAAGSRVGIGIEAKADESFGNDRIGPYYRKKRNPRSQVPQRVETLGRLVFGGKFRPQAEPWTSLRYQLLTGIAGTVLQAARDGAPIAVFAVYELVSRAATKATNLARNEADFQSFVRLLPGLSDIEVESGKLYGPIRYLARGDLTADVELYIGKVREDL